MKKRVISLLLVVITLLINSGATYATDVAGIHASHNLDDYYVALIAKGNGKMAVAVSINGVGTQDKIGVQEISIDHKTSANSNWTYYDSLYGAANPDFYVYGERSYDNEIYFDGVPGEIYRVTITAYAKAGSNWDTGYVTSLSAICT